MSSSIFVVLLLLVVVMLLLLVVVVVVVVRLMLIRAERLVKVAVAAESRGRLSVMLKKMTMAPVAGPTGCGLLWRSSSARS